MKPIITTTDYNTIRAIVLNMSNSQKTREIGQLIDELEKGTIVKDDEIDADIIRINSYFEVEEEATGQVMKFTLTLPAQANLAQKKISVLSPLGVALIGFREGMQIDWVLPGGPKKLKITKVVNSSEANG